MKQIIDKLNLYMCEHGCHNITVDVDKGVTPFMMPCLFTGRPDRPADPKKMRNGKCIGTAKSSMYPKSIDDEIPMPIPTHEWYRPDLAEYLELKSNAEKDHVDNGGLLLRPRTDKKPITHAEDQEYEIPKYKDFKAPRPVSKQYGKRFF